MARSFSRLRNPQKYLFKVDCFFRDMDDAFESLPAAIILELLYKLACNPYSSALCL